MVSINNNSKIIIKRIDSDTLEEIQQKYHIIQFRETGYKNNGYNVGYFEVIDKSNLEVKND